MFSLPEENNEVNKLSGLRNRKGSFEGDTSSAGQPYHLGCWFHWFTATLVKMIRSWNLTSGEIHDNICQTKRMPSTYDIYKYKFSNSSEFSQDTNVQPNVTRLYRT